MRLPENRWTRLAIFGVFAASIITALTILLAKKVENFGSGEIIPPDLQTTGTIFDGKTMSYCGSFDFSETVASWSVHRMEAVGENLTYWQITQSVDSATSAVTRKYAGTRPRDEAPSQLPTIIHFPKEPFLSHVTLQIKPDYSAVGSLNGNVAAFSTTTCLGLESAITAVKSFLSNKHSCTFASDVDTVAEVTGFFGATQGVTGLVLGNVAVIQTDGKFILELTQDGHVEHWEFDADGKNPLCQ